MNTYIHSKHSPWLWKPIHSPQTGSCVVFTLVFSPWLGCFNLLTGLPRDQADQPPPNLPASPTPPDTVVDLPNPSGPTSPFPALLTHTWLSLPACPTSWHVLNVCMHYNQFKFIRLKISCLNLIQVLWIILCTLSDRFQAILIWIQKHSWGKTLQFYISGVLESRVYLREDGWVDSNNSSTSCLPLSVNISGSWHFYMVWGKGYICNCLTMIPSNLNSNPYLIYAGY